MPASSSVVINTSSIQADSLSPQLLPYAATKAAIQNFTGGLAQMLGKKGIRVNCVPADFGPNMPLHVRHGDTAPQHFTLTDNVFVVFVAVRRLSIQTFGGSPAGPDLPNPFNSRNSPNR